MVPKFNLQSCLNKSNNRNVTTQKAPFCPLQFYSAQDVPHCESLKRREKNHLKVTNKLENTRKFCDQEVQATTLKLIVLLCERVQ